MKRSALEERLRTFANDKGFMGKGPLCVALVVTRHAMDGGLPLDANDLVTKGGGQVLGLGRAAVQAVLERHGIQRILAKEGGRTSRGSLGKMRDYVALLNGLGDDVNLATVEAFWIARVRQFFARHPFRLSSDASKGMHTVVRELIDQARQRDMEAHGVSYAGAMLQHLVGAALSSLRDDLTHHGYSTADEATGRVGDFLLGDVAVHVTTSPSEGLIDRCVQNVDEGYRPVVVTLKNGVIVALELARRRVIEERMDVLDIEQFMAARIYEMGAFTAEGRRMALSTMIERYNEIVDEVETDPSMRIKIA